MEKIKSLSKEQWNEVAEYRRECLQKGRSTEPVDRAALESAYRDFYKVMRGEELEEVYWFDGPIDAKKFLKKKGINIKSALNGAHWGSLELYWVGHFHHARRLGVSFSNEENAKLDACLKTTEGHMWWPFERPNCVVAVDRPCILETDNRGRLHNLSGPAVAYRDGYEAYAVEGVWLDKKTVMEPDKLTVQDVKNTRNAETRRAMLVVYGIPRYLRDTGAKLLDETEIERLYDSDEGRFMICTDGSTGRIYSLAVPETVNTVSEAQAALGGLPTDLLLPRS